MTPDCASDRAPVVQQWELDKPFTNARDRKDSQNYRQSIKLIHVPAEIEALAPQIPESLILTVAQ